jgi:hypothetical protein
MSPLCADEIYLRCGKINLAAARANILLLLSAENGDLTFVSPAMPRVRNKYIVIADSVQNLPWK